MSKTTNKKAKVEKKTSISQLVLNTFKTKPHMKSKEMINLVRSKFPKSKFNIYHFSWYRYQIKHEAGRYHKMFDKKQLASIFSK